VSARGTDPVTPRTVRALAPAKVNLSLEVLGRRADGYHEIRTWMMAVDLCDSIEVRATRTGVVRLSLGGPHASADIPSDERNLAWRAAMLVLSAARERHLIDETTGLDVALEKHIPSQSGLGGASSDAAAVLLAAQSALGVTLPFEVASNALATFGSDCAYFLHAAESGVALCEGRGERVQPSDSVRRDWNVAILTPDVRCATESVYRAMSTLLRPSLGTHTLPATWSDIAASAARALFFNQLEEAALKAVPELRPWRRVLDECGASHFRMSGSGSSFFGVFDDCVEATTTLERLVTAARGRGLTPRGHWITHPRGAAAGLAS
jgi:4-diphosphocytidyl-2-C-methyl-D-erythritol kinase